MMKRVTLLIFLVFLASIVLAAGKDYLVGPDGRHFKLDEKNEAIQIKKLVNAESAKLSPMSVNGTGDYYLMWDDGELNVNFGFETGDTCAQYMVPLAGCEVKAIYIYNYDFEGTASISIHKSNYLGNISSTDYTDANGWFGDWAEDGSWIQGTCEAFNQPPVGEELWPALGTGGYPINITADNAASIIEISTELLGVPDVKSEPFMICAATERTAGWGFYATDAPALPYHSLKYYSGVGTSGNSGWHIRSYGWMVWALVHYYEDIPPFIQDVTTLYATLSTGPIEISAKIFDDNPTGGDMGVAHAYVVFSVNGGDEQEVEMTTSGTDSIYTAEIPGQTPGSEITYYVKAVDVNGNESKSKSITYIVYKPVHPTLFIYDDNSLPEGYEWYYWYGADTAGVFPYDLWLAKYGPISNELLENYEIVVHIMGGGPVNQPMNIGEIYKTWLEGATSEVPRRLFISGQDYGYISDYADTTFPDGTFEKDYLGIGTLGPQDVNAQFDDDGNLIEESYALWKYAVDPVQGDTLTGYLFNYAGDSLQLFYDPNYEVGFYNWIDNLTPTSSAHVCMTDPNNEDAAVAIYNEGENWKTVFWALDPLALSFYDPVDTTSKYHWVLTDVGNPLQKVLGWFGLPVLSVEPVGEPVPGAFVLKQNYPNPFNPTTTIEFSIPTNSKVTLSVYNVLGQKVRTLVNDRLPAKHYRVLWDGTDDKGNLVPSGVYFYTIRTDGFSATKKMILMK